jgi:hypothetical protein
VIAEFKSMVRSLHAAGLEVILDVVFNHTAETDQFGPTLSFRGIDNQSYYRLPAGDLAAYENFSGCGNTLNLAQPRVLQLVMDALRYWVEVMHVDGFRFDLAAALARDSAFLAAVRQDPLLQNVKLIAEPWDHRPRWLPPGTLPARLERMERPLPRRRACLLADSRSGRRSLNWRSGCPDRASCSRMRPDGRHRQASTSSPRMTASPCAIWSATRKTQRAQRRGKPRRARPQSVVELRRGR